MSDAFRVRNGVLYVIVETSAAAAQIESRALLDGSLPPKHLAYILDSAALVDDIGFFGTVGPPGERTIGSFLLSSTPGYGGLIQLLVSADRCP